MSPLHLFPEMVDLESYFTKPLDSGQDTKSENVQEEPDTDTVKGGIEDEQEPVDRQN